MATNKPSELDLAMQVFPMPATATRGSASPIENTNTDVDTGI